MVYLTLMSAVQSTVSSDRIIST